MRMELWVHPEDVPRVSRARRAFAAAHSRPRTHRVRFTLHDTEEGDLATASLIVAEQRGLWRVERLTPGPVIWLPATPPPIREEVPARGALLTLPPRVAPDELTPIVAFDGRETTHSVFVAGGQVTLTVCRGSAWALRDPPADAARTDAAATAGGQGISPLGISPLGISPLGISPLGTSPLGTSPLGTSPLGTSPLGTSPLGTDAGAIDAGGHEEAKATERLSPMAPLTTDAPIALARLRIEGPDAVVRRLALHLTANLRVAVPRASLPAEALGRLCAIAIPPRRAGAPDLPRSVDPPFTTGSAFRTILGHLVDVLLWLAPAATDGSTGTEAVHQMRVAVRRARSALTIFRSAVDGPELQGAADHLKALGTRLGPTRDWDVFVTETLPEIAAARPADRRLTRLSAAAQDRREACQNALGLYLTGSAFRVLGVELAWLAAAETALSAVPGTPDTPEGLTHFAAHVLQRRRRKLHAAGKEIDALDIPALHALRLRAKRTRYAAEMFAFLYPGRRTSRFIRRLSRLQQHLGVLNDGAVAAELLKELGGPGGRHAYATGLVQGFAAARSAFVRPKILRAWEKFRRSDRFWG